MGEGGGGEEKAVYIDAVLWKHSPRTNPLLNLKNKLRLDSTRQH